MQKLEKIVKRTLTVVNLKGEGCHRETRRCTTNHPSTIKETLPFL